MFQDQCIVAQSTPQGKGALALIRLSGTDALRLADSFARLPGNKKLANQPTHTVHFGFICDRNGERIDQVLFIVMHAPSTFTGQDTVEITCHNNPFIIEQIIEQAIHHGARIAQSGEFTRRAVENKKLDLLQAEAINDILCAQTETALKKSLAQLEGSMSHWLVACEKQLITILAWVEASFEFFDDDDELEASINQKIDDLLEQINTVKKTFDIQQQIRQGFRIALIGPVNSGKSSLFNRILQQERSIVTEIAGTTRDVVEAGLYRNGNHWTLIDTAGLRTTDDIIEQEGIKRSFEQAHKADIVIITFDGSRKLSADEHSVLQELYDTYQEKAVLVRTKTDKPLCESWFQEKEVYDVSSTTGTGCVELEQAIEDKINTILQRADVPFLLNKRQYHLLVDLEKKVLHIQDMLKKGQPSEIIAHQLRYALEDISQISGKTLEKEVLDSVFVNFCVGK